MGYWLSIAVKRSRICGSMHGRRSVDSGSSFGKMKKALSSNPFLINALSKHLEFKHEKKNPVKHSSSEVYYLRKWKALNPRGEVKNSVISIKSKPGRKIQEEKYERKCFFTLEKFPHQDLECFSVYYEYMLHSFIYIQIEALGNARVYHVPQPFSSLTHTQMTNAMCFGCTKKALERELLTHNRKMFLSLRFASLFVICVAFKWHINVLTRLMMMPAMEMRIFGPFNRRYRRSTPFQNDTKYRLIWCEKWHVLLIIQLCMENNCLSYLHVVASM